MKRISATAWYSYRLSICLLHTSTSHHQPPITTKQPLEGFAGFQGLAWPWGWGRVGGRGVGEGGGERQWSVNLYHRTASLCLGRPPRWPSGYGVRLESGRSQSSNPACDWIFPGSSHTSDLKIGTQWLPCQAPGGIGSMLGLVGPVSVYCDWVRWKFGSATSISVWQHANCLSSSRP